MKMKLNYLEIGTGFGQNSISIKKNFGFIKALRECLMTYLTSIVKFIFYFIIRNNFKKKIYFNRTSGFYNALTGKSSWYRPNLND